MILQRAVRGSEWLKRTQPYAYVSDAFSLGLNV